MTTLMLLDNQFLRCVPLKYKEEELLKETAATKAYRFIEANLANIQSPEELMKRVADALKFPAHFGGNWDAFLDMITDLSWNPAGGYVILIRNADATMRLPSDQLAIFLRVCVATVKRWQSGEDEAGNAVAQIPFYLLLEGNPPFCRLVSDLLTIGHG